MRIENKHYKFDMDSRALCNAPKGSAVMRLRDGVITGPYLVAYENPDAFARAMRPYGERREYLQDGYINGSVLTYLVKLSDGYRATIEEADTFSLLDAAVILN